MTHKLDDQPTGEAASSPDCAMPMGVLIADSSMVVPVAGYIRRTWLERLKSKPFTSHRVGVVYVPDPSPRVNGWLTYMHPETIKLHGLKAGRGSRA